MHRLAAILLTLLLAGLTAHAAVRLIYVEQELKNAKTVSTITVLGYNKSWMFYRLPGSKDTLKISARIKASSESFRLDLIKSKWMHPTDMAGKWPSVGQTVLMLASVENTVSLFAVKSGAYYRFWDPNNIPFANSFFVFPNTYPYKQLPRCLNYLSGGSKGTPSCSDGCLVAYEAIKERRGK
jgi:hypothetical protein